MDGRRGFVFGVLRLTPHTVRGMNMRTHKRVIGEDYREAGQTDFEYDHTALCGHVRADVTFDDDRVDCRICLRQLEKWK